MLVPSFFVLPVVSLLAQFSVGVPDESRSPMQLKSSGGECGLEMRGAVWTGKVSTRGGSLEGKDMEAKGILAAVGAVRFHFGNGRYQDVKWLYQSSARPVLNFRMTPAEAAFEGGLRSPVKAEAKVFGVYRADGATCGESGGAMKDRFERVRTDQRKDAQAAIDLAEKLPAAKFQKAVAEGLIQDGPYARESTTQSNAMLRSALIDPSGALRPEYKQILRRWLDSLKPAK
jgi:hypothetical protein